MKKVKEWMRHLEQRILFISEGACQAPFFSLETLLVAVSLVYRGIAALRVFLYRMGILKRYRLACRVISVGNIVAGGTGKTPMVMHLASLLCDMGLRPVVISRGYGGYAGKEGAVAGDGYQVLLPPEASGDEPCMMAGRCRYPVIVDHDRVRAGLRAMRWFRPHVILLDDGFQHLRLRRDLDVVLMDAARPLGNGRHLPAGRLREPPSAVTSRAHVVVYTRSGEPHPPPRKWDRGKSVFYARHVPLPVRYIRAGRSGAVADDGFSLSMIAGKTALVFSAISDNKGFRQSVESLGVCVADHLAFRDHHRFHAREIQAIQERSQTLGCHMVVTTEKDYVRLGRPDSWPVDLAVLGVDIEFFSDSYKLQDILWPPSGDLLRLDFRQGR